MKIPRLLEDFLDINRAVFVCVRIRNSIVTSCSIKLSAVLLIACHFCHEVYNLPLAPKAKRRGSCLWMYGKKNKKKQTNMLSLLSSMKSLTKLGLVLLFRYGLCLSITYLENPRKLLCYFWWRHMQIRVSVTVQVWFMPINKSLFISDGGVYKLGLVLPFRYGLCYFWWRRLQIRVSVTVREWLIPTNIPSKISCFLQWRRLQIRVSVTVQVWFMPINKSLFVSDGGVYKLGLVLPFIAIMSLSWNRADICSPNKAWIRHRTIADVVILHAKDNFGAIEPSLLLANTVAGVMGKFQQVYGRYRLILIFPWLYICKIHIHTDTIYTYIQICVHRNVQNLPTPKSSRHWFRYWLVACPAPSHYLK